MYIKHGLILLGCLLSIPVFAINTQGYTTIKELKAWDRTVDVYFNDGQQHECTDSTHKTRFVVDAEKDQQIGFLLTALTAERPVQLAYTCNSDGYPRIIGVRLR